MMGIVATETCWAYKKYNKIKSGTELVGFKGQRSVGNNVTVLQRDHATIYFPANNNAKMARVEKNYPFAKSSIKNWRRIRNVGTAPRVLEIGVR